MESVESIYKSRWEAPLMGYSVQRIPHMIKPFAVFAGQLRLIFLNAK